MKLTATVVSMRATFPEKKSAKLSEWAHDLDGFDGTVEFAVNPNEEPGSYWNTFEITVNNAKAYEAFKLGSRHVIEITPA